MSKDCKLPTLNRFCKGNGINENENLQFLAFTDEASFTGKGIFNTQNEHVRAESNPQLGVSRKYRERLPINV